MSEPSIECIPLQALTERVRSFKENGWRLVQIGATRRPDQVELTYSFDRNSQLTNLRIVLGGSEPAVPSISSIYWCAFLYENEIHDLFQVAIQGISVDFQGNFYQTRVKFPFGTTKAPVPAKPATSIPAGAGSPPAPGSDSSPITATASAGPGATVIRPAPAPAALTFDTADSRTAPVI